MCLGLQIYEVIVTLDCFNLGPIFGSVSKSSVELG